MVLRWSNHINQMIRTRRVYPTGEPPQMLCGAEHQIEDGLGSVQELATGVHYLCWRRGKRRRPIDVERGLRMAIRYEKVVDHFGSAGDLRCEVKKRVSHCIQYDIQYTTWTKAGKQTRLSTTRRQETPGGLYGVYRVAGGAQRHSTCGLATLVIDEQAGSSLAMPCRR